MTRALGRRDGHNPFFKILHARSPAVHPTALRVISVRVRPVSWLAGRHFRRAFPEDQRSVQWLQCDETLRLQLRGQLGIEDLCLSRPPPYSRLIPLGFAHCGEP